MPLSSNNIVAGNFLLNNEDPVIILNGVNNTVGGTAPGRAQLDFRGCGLRHPDHRQRRNRQRGGRQLIGTDASGTSAFGDIDGDGVDIEQGASKTPSAAPTPARVTSSQEITQTA